MMQRVLVTGLGGELGTQIAQLLEGRDDVGEIVGCDLVPPRRRLRRSTFVRIDPARRERLRDFVLDFAPTHVVHVGVYEPASRLTPAQAARTTEVVTATALPAAARAGALESVVVRSGLEVYGRPRRASVPDESVPPWPGSPFGTSLLRAEAIAAGLRRHRDVSVAALRFAPVVGSHVPSPLGRYLRLPVVPVSAVSDPPFSLLHPTDASRAVVAALALGYDGPLNVVAPGAATPWQAVRLGGRVPLPVPPGMWSSAARLAEFAGAAIAPHVVELLRFGRTGAGSQAVEVLGLGEIRSTQHVLRDLYEWAEVVPLQLKRAVA
jgi:UDP-glucose 4-epimerase